MMKEQKIILAVGTLALAVIFSYVPFQSTYNRKGDNSVAYEGYSLIWAPPDPLTVCVKTYGMWTEPSAPHRTTQKANRECFVSPSVTRILISAVAVTFLTLTAYLLLGVFSTKSRMPRNSTPKALGHSTPPRETSQVATLASELRRELGSQFPVSSGSASKTDPLIITALDDYVAIEYMVVKHLLGKLREAYELDKQSLLNQNGRHIDELVFKVRAAGAADWTGRRHFYFDVTEGFGKLT